MKLKTVIEAGSPAGEQLRLLALQKLVNGIGNLNKAKKNFEDYLDALKDRDNNLSDIEDFAPVSDVDRDDVIWLIRSLDDMILTLRASDIEDDRVYDEKELERQVIYKKK